MREETGDLIRVCVGVAWSQGWGQGTAVEEGVMSSALSCTGGPLSQGDHAGVGWGWRPAALQARCFSVNFYGMQKEYKPYKTSEDSYMRNALVNSFILFNLLILIRCHTDVDT